MLNMAHGIINRYWRSNWGTGSSVDRKIFVNCWNGKFHIHDTRTNRCKLNDYVNIIFFHFQLEIFAPSTGTSLTNSINFKMYLIQVFFFPNRCAVCFSWKGQHTKCHSSFLNITLTRFSTPLSTKEGIRFLTIYLLWIPLLSLLVCQILFHKTV
jgi:hypothetical protein